MAGSGAPNRSSRGKSRAGREQVGAPSGGSARLCGARAMSGHLLLRPTFRPQPALPSLRRAVSPQSAPLACRVAPALRTGWPRAAQSPKSQDVSTVSLSLLKRSHNAREFPVVQEPPIVSGLIKEVLR